VLLRHWIALFAGLGAFLLAVPIPAAQAHGALQNPPSRAMVCGMAGSRTAKSTACRAAAAVGPQDALADWDQIRVPDINGQDRQKIPDGRLCSGGLPEFAGLDLARADWPVTRLRGGAAFTFRYRVTIPHDGSFRLYVTRDGYDPARPLKWSDLQAKPFLTVSNPVARGGFYTLSGRLPAGRSGRHVIYTIWQTTSTPDTYYSCSDVVFTTKATATRKARPAAPAPEATSAAPAPNSSPVAGAAPGSNGSPVAGASSARKRDNSSLMAFAAGSIAFALVVGTVATLVLARSMRRRRAT
jgi:predicted carbohydrate-binding protein with CBM5 and CBM33 domain